MSVIELRNTSTRYHLHWPWLPPTLEPGPFVWRSMSQGICWRWRGYIAAGHVTAPAGAKAMRSVVTLSLSIVVCASTHAATVHHVPTRHHVTVGRSQVGRSQGVIRPSQGVTTPQQGHIAVPGWSEDATLRWTDQATGHGD